MTPRPRIKICGITRREDAEMAVRLGADAVGFVFWPGSPRRITADAAHAIIAGLPSHVVKVGVFVNAPADEVSATVAAAGLDAVQLHGDEEPAPYARVPAKLIKAVTLHGSASLAAALALPGEVTLLVDALDPVRRGGTGMRADWETAAALARERPIVLAGGLSADNVRAAVAAVRPWGVDVSSGVESAPGIKDKEKLMAFFEAVATEERV